METATIERNDSGLGVRFRDGDDEAFREVCQRFVGPLLRFSTSQLGDSQDARDAVQQTLLQAWRA